MKIEEARKMYERRTFIESADSNGCSAPELKMKDNVLPSLDNLKIFDYMNGNAKKAMQRESENFTLRLMGKSSDVIKRYIKRAEPKEDGDLVSYYFDLKRSTRYAAAVELLPIKIEIEEVLKDHYAEVSRETRSFLQNREIKLAQDSIYLGLADSVREQFRPIEDKFAGEYQSQTSDYLMKEAERLASNHPDTLPGHMMNLARRSAVSRILIERQYDSIDAAVMAKKQ